jgi:hypothetical protein
MSYFGYPDLDRPIPFEAGNLYYPFGGGPFSLTPNRCSIADLEDGRVNFSLDMYRPAIPLPETRGYGVLELRLNAQYATEKALASLREQHPQAVLSHCALMDWEFRLAPGPVALGSLTELLAPSLLASNNLGSARMVVRLSPQGAVLLKNLLLDDVRPVYAIAEAQMKGISPRVDAVVRFRAQELIEEIGGLASETGILSWKSLVNFFGRSPDDLSAEVSGQVEESRVYAFGEAMADRIVDRFGSYVTAQDGADDHCIQLSPLEDLEDSELLWSLSQPFLASRRVAMRFDLFSDVRQRIQKQGSEAFIRYHTSSDLSSFGESNITVFCNLPAERVGVTDLGVNLIFPAKPPDRPQSKSLTISFEPPQDLVDAQVLLAPGEALEYNYSTFAVIADQHGVGELHGPVRSGSGSPLRVTPDDFPIDFAQIEATQELVRQASIHGICRHQYKGREYNIPFTFDNGRYSISLGLPKGSEIVGIVCSARDRLSGKQIHLPSFDSLPVRLDLFSFPEYGFHEVEFLCGFDGDERYYAIDVLPEDTEETLENMTTLVFTPAQPRRRYGWFAQSPFRPGFLYRPHTDDGALQPWERAPYPAGQVVIYPRRPEIRPAREAIARSERPALRPARSRTRTVSETAEVDASFWAKGAPRSPQEDPTDTLFYTLDSDPTAKFYIPRYSVDVQRVSGQQRYRIALVDENEVSALTIHLVKAPADSIQDAARDAREFPHDVDIILDFLQAPPSGARKALVFQELTRQDPIVTARLTFASLEERDEVFRALTETNREARLVVRRRILVDIPQPAVSDPGIKIINYLPINYTLLNVPFKATRFPPVPDPILVNPSITPQPVDTLITFNTLNTIPVLSHLTLPESGILLRRMDPDVVGPVVFGPVIDKLKNLPVVVKNILPTPVLAFTGKEARTVRGNEFWYVSLSITNWQDFSADYFQASPDLPPCGMNANASRTWVDIFNAATHRRLYGFCGISSPDTLTKLWFAVPVSEQIPERVYVQFEDRRARVMQKSNIVETRTPEPQAPSYVTMTRELEQVVQPQPFAFPPSLHSYMFQGVTPGSDGSGLVRYRLQTEGKFHTYLQDMTNPKRVYCFPDEFKIARRPTAPFLPYVTVRVTSRSSTKDADVLFDYMIVPFTDPARLTEAANTLLADPRFGATQVQFEPFITSDVRFFRDRPTQNGSAKDERSDVSLVLQGMLKDSLNMKFSDFSTLFDALHGETASLFLGHMDIEVPGEPKEVIPFTARMDDLAGELFLYNALANTDGSISVSLLNAIESPLRINALDAFLSVGGEVIPTSTQGLTLPQPNLAPGGTLEFKVIPQKAANGSETPQVRFSLRDIRAIPDREAILNAILDRSTVEFFNMVTVKAVASLFQPSTGMDAASTGATNTGAPTTSVNVTDTVPSGNGSKNDAIQAILVEFQGGGTGELNANQLEATVRIDYPVEDVVLKKSIDENYTYTVTVIWADGRQKKDAEPRRQSSQMFYVNVVK